MFSILIFSTLGETTCDKDIQGIFINLEKPFSSLFDLKPLSNYILPIKNESVRLAILVSLNGGRQNEIISIEEVERFVIDVSSLASKVQNFLQKTKQNEFISPEDKVAIEGNLKMTKNLHDSIQGMESAIALQKNIPRTLTLLNQINSYIGYLKEIVMDKLAPMVFKSRDWQLNLMIFEIQSILPNPFNVNLGGEPVKTNLQGISFYFRTHLCIGQLCLNGLNTTVEYLAEENCISNEPYMSMFRAKGKVLKEIPLSNGNILTLSKGQIVDLLFPRNSDQVEAHFGGDGLLFGLKQSVDVTLDKKQLTFQMKGEIFNKYMADMKVTADTKQAVDWRSLIFRVNGRMTKTSQLLKFLQEKVTNFAADLAQKAVKRVQNCKNSLKRAERKAAYAKKSVEEKRFIRESAYREKSRKELKLKNIKRNYEDKKSKLQPIFNEIAELWKQTCEIQNCTYIVTDTCIPAVCQEKVVVNYTIPNCNKIKRWSHKTSLVPKLTEKIIGNLKCEKEQINNCSATPTYISVATGNAFACINYNKIDCSVVRVVKIIGEEHLLTTKIKGIEKLECGQPKILSVISGYREPRRCCKNKVGGKMEVLDPQCVFHNLACLKNMSLFKDENRRLNETLFEDFIAMRKEEEQALKAQLEVNKARINLTVATKELEYESALLKKYEIAKESINLGKVTLREKLGLNLKEKIKNLGGKALVTVEKLVFSVAMSRSSTKTRLLLTAYVKTFEGSNKAINFSMDFNRESDSLTSASRRIVEKLFGTSHSRRRRSAGQTLLSSVTNDNTSSWLEGKKCVFARESNLFFADILASLLFAIQSERNFEETMATGIRSLDNLLAVKDNLIDFTSGPQQQIRRLLSDTVQSIKDVQLNNSDAGSWNDTLDDLRAFLDILSWEKNFTECSGVQDCTDFFFDHLGELYEMEYHPRAIEIKTMLQLLERIISSMMKENHRMSTLEDMISQAKLLVNKSRDDLILCGKKPEIVKNSPVQVTAINGETVTLVCEAKSTLQVQYLWFRNGQILEENNSTVLDLQNVTKQSEGAYKCQASNRRGSVVSNVTIVEVHQRPSITEQPRDAQGLVGDEKFIMICNSTGVPRPLTEWFFIPIKAEKHEVVHVNITTPYLRLSSLKIENSGFYYCNVSNLHGTVQSRMARVDVLRFFSGVPRMAVRLNLKQCMSAASPENNISYCEDKTSIKSQQLDLAAFEYITQKMLERVNWPVERVRSKHYSPFPNAVISFVVNGDISPVSEGKKIDLLYRFSLSRQRMGNSLKKLYFALQEEGMKLNQKNLTITGDAESLAFRLLPQLCPNGTRRHENGFLCGM